MSDITIAAKTATDRREFLQASLLAAGLAVAERCCRPRPLLASYPYPDPDSDRSRASHCAAPARQVTIIGLGVHAPGLVRIVP